MKGWRLVVVVTVLAGALAVPRVAQAAYYEHAGWGALATLANLAYMPAKVGYAMVGGFTGGLAYAVTGGDLETAEQVWIPCLGGTYVLTPKMLQGQEPIVFAAMPGGEASLTQGDALTRRSLDDQALAGF